MQKKLKRLRITKNHSLTPQTRRYMAIYVALSCNGVLQRFYRDLHYYSNVRYFQVFTGELKNSSSPNSKTSHWLL